VIAEPAFDAVYRIVKVTERRYRNDLILRSVCGRNVRLGLATGIDASVLDLLRACRARPGDGDNATKNGKQLPESSRHNVLLSPSPPVLRNCCAYHWMVDTILLRINKVACKCNSLGQCFPS